MPRASHDRMRPPTSRCLALLALPVAAVALAWFLRSASVPDPGWIMSDIQGLHYAVLLPEPWMPDHRYPVLLYLHQLDMGTNRAGLIRQVNAWFATPGFRAQHPAIVVVPMLDQAEDKGGRLVNFGGKRQGQFGEAETIAALREVMSRHLVDPGRIYVTGNSMGGMGTWEMLLAYNDQTGTKGRIFAAGLPLAGRHATADPVAAAQALARVPIWAIHGGRDTEVGLDWDRGMARLLAGKETFHYTEDAALGHDVWDSYYVKPQVWEWLFSQRGVRSTSASGTPQAE